ncbi:MAG: TldD/PmbA family protein [Nitrospirae bacterium]|nr:TldD/PmbA family protein [Nitrospirota bacterium]
MDTGLLASDAVEQALKSGCDAAEVFIKTSKRLSVEVKYKAVEALEAANDCGIAVRVLKNRKLGFSYITKPEELRQAVEKAVEGTLWTEADQYNEIPNPPHPPFDKGGMGGILVLDKEIENISEEDAIKKAFILEEGAVNFDKRIKKVRNAMAIFSVSTTAIYNSKGINISYKTSAATAHILALASDGQDNQLGGDFAVSRRLSDIDFTSTGANASKMAISFLGARKISPVKAPVILDSSTAFNFLGILSASLSADAVQKKRSFLAGKIGEQIISPLINVIDNALMPWGIGTKPVDDEGMPGSKKTLISEGRLTAFIHNTYTAKKDGVASTGNAVRGSFKSLPGVDVTNLYIEPYKKVRIQGFKDLRGQVIFHSNPRTFEPSNPLIKSLSKGLLVLDAMGVHTANPISGDFSIGISGLWIENGSAVYPVKEALISGNILELFKKVEEVGSDLRFYGNIGSPSLLIGEMDISA